MDFELSEQQRAIRDTARQFAEAEMAPHARQWDEEHIFPVECMRKAAALGFGGIYVGADVGGSALSRLDATLIFEELAQGCTSTAAYISIHNMAAWMIDAFGGAAQRQNFLPKLCTMEHFASYCLTEPDAGSDAASLRTRAVADGDHFVLDGTKIWVTSGSLAGVVIVYARTNPDVSKAKGISAFLVDPKTPGIAIGDFPMRTLKRDNVAEVHFKDVFVPDANLLGEPGGGFPVLGSALDMGRYSVAARCIGQSQRCIDLAVAYAREREAFGQKIGEFQMIQQKIADMICRTEGARGVVYRLGRMKDAGIERASMEASLAKLMASEAATQNALDAIQIHGGYGFTAEYEVGRLLLEAKVLEIGEGTSELHRKLIAEHALGLRTQ